MKSTKSFLGLAALWLAIIALALTGCPDPNGGGGDPDTTPTVTSVAVSPATPSVAPGGTQAFIATVTGTNSPDQTVTWAVSRSGGAVKTGTAFTGATLTVAGDEPIGTLTVTATSTVDATKSGTATVTVYAEGTRPTVTSVAVSPATPSVAPGGTQAFIAIVTGTNSPDQTVTWAVSRSGGTAKTGTAFTGATLTVAIDEPVGTLTVTATSTVDTTKSGTATVTVSTAHTGSISITVGLNNDEITIDGDKDDGNNVISKSGASNTPTSLILSATGYTDVVWYVDGSSTGISGSPVTLNAADYSAQWHSITFSGKVNGRLYSSQHIPFVVLN
jgi:hypothetical protein